MNFAQDGRCQVFLWSTQSIKRALANQSKTIRLPVHIVHKISKMNHTARRLLEELGREPTDEELAKEMGVSASHVARMRMTAMRPASLDARMGDSDSEVLGDVIEDERAEMAPEALEEKTQHRDLREMIESLNGREAGILRARFGLDGRRRKTLAETADQLGLTRERVRQLQNRALTKLRK
jgi:RNA polymerase primary sigma factor